MATLLNRGMPREAVEALPLQRSGRGINRKPLGCLTLRAGHAHKRVSLPVETTTGPERRPHGGAQQDDDRKDAQEGAERYAGDGLDTGKDQTERVVLLSRKVDACHGQEGRERPADAHPDPGEDHQEPAAQRREEAPRARSEEAGAEEEAGSGHEVEDGHQREEGDHPGHYVVEDGKGAQVLGIPQCQRLICRVDLPSPSGRLDFA